MRRVIALLAGLLAIGPGCGADPAATPSALDEELTLQSSTARFADTLWGASTWYRVRPDMRACISPLCGGWWVARLNLEETRCPDGALRRECYVAEADWRALGLDEIDLAALHGAISHAVVRGRIDPRVYDRFGDLGQLVVTEAWRARTDTPPIGAFYRVTDARVPCLGRPCLDLLQVELNTRSARFLSSIDFSPSGATPAEIEAAWAAIRDSGEGVIIAGWSFRNPAPTAPAWRQLVVTQLYARVEPSPVPRPCGGIVYRPCPSGQWCDVMAGACGGADLPGVCKTVPPVCSTEYVPVCGCDHMTYTNDCTRLGARAPLDHVGECDPERPHCGGFLGLPCPEGQFCDLTPGVCGGADLDGTCKDVKLVCLAIVDEVCGCDGRTYANDCVRQRAKVQLDHHGRCAL